MLVILAPVLTGKFVKGQVVPHLQRVSLQEENSKHREPKSFIMVSKNGCPRFAPEEDSITII